MREFYLSILHGKRMIFVWEKILEWVLGTENEAPEELNVAELFHMRNKK